MPLEPETKGYQKMIRYIQELVRNEVFQKDMQELKELGKKTSRMPEGMYDDWSPEEQKHHDFMNNELGALIKDYEKLRKRAQKLMNDEYWEKRIELAEYYGLDTPMLAVAEDMLDKKTNLIDFYSHETDMCRIEALWDDNISPGNPGEEIIYMQPHKQITYYAYPAAVAINIKAAKRDVLDFIEKRWRWIQNAMIADSDKPLKFRKRKHSQEMLDFIWDNRQRSAEQIKALLDETHPGNGLVYYEIQEILRQEKKRRTQDLT